MADIRTYPFISHLRADPTSWVQHQHNGKVRHVGAGLSFWFRPRTAALAEVPLDDREQTVLFHARTADFQDVTVASTVTYRVEDPPLDGPLEWAGAIHGIVAFGDDEVCCRVR